METTIEYVAGLTKAERRRELLEKLDAMLDRLQDEITTVNYRALRDELPMLLDLRGMIDGALLGDLADDAAWAELLEMLVQEAVDDGNHAGTV